LQREGQGAERQEEHTPSTSKKGELVVEVRYDTDFPNPKVDFPAQFLCDMAEFIEGIVPTVVSTSLPNIPKTNKLSAIISNRLTSRIRARMTELGTHRTAIAGQGDSQGVEQHMAGEQRGNISGGRDGWGGGEWSDALAGAEADHSEGERYGCPNPHSSEAERRSRDERRGGEERGVVVEQGGEETSVPGSDNVLAGQIDNSKEQGMVAEGLRNCARRQDNINELDQDIQALGKKGGPERREQAGTTARQAGGQKRKGTEDGGVGGAPGQRNMKRGKKSVGEVKQTQSKQAPKETHVLQMKAPTGSGKENMGQGQVPPLAQPTPGNRTSKRKEREVEDEPLEGPAESKKAAGVISKRKKRGGEKKSECYDCAWLSLTALSTVTCNLWL
jgi:hypothetical protein